MWEISTTDQLYTFLIFLITGVVLKLFYDIMRSKRKVKKSGNIRVFVFDIIFWLVSAAITFLLLLVRTNGEARGYTFVAEIIGFVGCHFTISKIWVKILCFLFKIWYRLTNALSVFMNKISAHISKIWNIISDFLLKSLKKAFKTVKKLLKNRKGMLYTKRNHADMNSMEVVGDG